MSYVSFAKSRCFNIAFLGLLLALTPILAISTSAQTSNPQEEREEAFRLFNESKFTKAVPLLEKLAAANPSDVEIISRLGLALFATTPTIKEAQKKTEVRARAREFLKKAVELGDRSLITQLTLNSLTNNSDSEITYSEVRAADRAMQEGEAAFATGDFPKALAAYDRALTIDPHLYEAALYKGDVYFKSNDQDKAGEWFARAVAINPDRETAYRYWGDALMRQGKMAEARDKFIEAYLAEPYNQLARNGFLQWASASGARLGHPQLQIPVKVVPSGNGNTSIQLDQSVLKTGDSDASSAWMTYGLIRSSWSTGTFLKEYPNEKNYRHSLKEEAAALRAVLRSLANRQKEHPVAELSTSLRVLSQLEEAGVLEPYILLAMPDRGIAQDYPDYRRANRDKLRDYVRRFVIVAGNN